MTSGRLLITGINGSIGVAVANLAHKAGFDIIGYDLSPPAKFQFDMLHITGDIRDSKLMTSALNQADAVVHLAAYVHRVPQNAEETTLVFSLNRDVPLQMLNMLSAKKLPFILLSTASVWGEHATGELSEDTPTCPDTPYAQSKLQAERPVLDFGGTVLRIPMAYGAYDKGNMARMVKAIQRRRFIIPGNGQSPKSFINRWNVAKAVMTCLTTNDSAGKIYLAADSERVGLHELCKLITAQLHCPTPPRVPLPLVKGAGLIGSAVQKWTRLNVPLTLDVVWKLTKSLVCDDSRIRNELGYRPIRSLEEGLREEIDWLLSLK